MTEPTESRRIQGSSRDDTGGHYRFVYKGVKLDPARIVSIYGALHPMQGTIVKKALMAGRRGYKDQIQDIDDIINAAERWKEMIEEDLDEDHRERAVDQS